MEISRGLALLPLKPVDHCVPLAAAVFEAQVGQGPPWDSVYVILDVHAECCVRQRLTPLGLGTACIGNGQGPLAAQNC